MFNKLRSLFGRSRPVQKTFSPYKNKALNRIYHSLFGDDWTAYDTAENSAPDSLWLPVLASEPNAKALLEIARDAQLDSRLRLVGVLAGSSQRMKLCRSEFYSA